MIDKKKVLDLIADREEAGLNDILAAEIRSEIIEELGTNEEEIIEFLDALDDDNLYMISETFQNLAEALQSDTFTLRLVDIQDNHPNINISADIEATNL